MKIITGSYGKAAAAALLLLTGTSLACAGQDQAAVLPPLPENIRRIVSTSCMPCHSSRGGLLSRTKLNFSEWTSYSESKQKKKAQEMYKQARKDKMPPESARENNPGIALTKDQIEAIGAWADSLRTAGN